MQEKNITEKGFETKWTGAFFPNEQHFVQGEEHTRIFSGTVKTQQNHESESKKHISNAVLLRNTAHTRLLVLTGGAASLQEQPTL